MKVQRGRVGKAESLDVRQAHDIFAELPTSFLDSTTQHHIENNFTPRKRPRIEEDLDLGQEPGLSTDTGSSTMSSNAEEEEFSAGKVRSTGETKLRTPEAHYTGKQVSRSPQLVVDSDSEDEEGSVSSDAGLEDDGRSLYPRGGTTRGDDAETVTSTRTLYDGEIEYDYENGRRYHHDYFMPCDEEEQDRMHIIHQVFWFLLSNSHTTIPIPPTTPNSPPYRILDIGTGTGDWAISVGEAYPHADITGIDISSIQPTAVPSNVFFEIFDAEDVNGWTWPLDTFNLIHLRNMNGAFDSWPLIYKRCHQHLVPRGWIELVEFDNQDALRAAMGADSQAGEWHAAVLRATQLDGKDYSGVHAKASALHAAGFIDVEVQTLAVPLGNWPEGSQGAEFSKLWLLTCMAGLEAVSLRPLTQKLGWKAEDVRKVCKALCGEMRVLAQKGGARTNVGVKVIRGRKPDGVVKG